MFSYPKSEGVVAAGIMKGDMSIDEKQAIVKVMFLD